MAVNATFFRDEEDMKMSVSNNKCYNYPRYNSRIRNCQEKIGTTSKYNLRKKWENANSWTDNDSEYEQTM